MVEMPALWCGHHKRQTLRCTPRASVSAKHQQRPRVNAFVLKLFAVARFSQTHWSNQRIRRPVSIQDAHMHHPKPRDPFTTEPAARSSYDSFFSNVSEDLTGTETILLVEDDDGLRILVHRTLQRFGYRVIAARDGHEAVDVSEAHEGALHLILSDVMMPGLSSVDVVERVQRRFKDAAALFMSGRLSHALLEAGALRNGAAFIQKPFVPDVLARKVREVLDGPPPPAAVDSSQT
jgi:CheY-like chemotaxis protein